MIFFIITTLLVSEVALQVLVKYLKKDFQWLITEEDEYPDFDKKALKKFFKNSFDKELGWVRKPNSSGFENGKYGKIEYHIDSNGSRENFIEKETLIATFGDSYTFCRQVEDDQTWQVYLSKKLNNKVLNFGVGNYGVDQALLYYQRHEVPMKTKTVVLGFVPETICRIQSYWKHYLEFGNTFAFKPRFTLENGKLILHGNPISELKGFNDINRVIDSIKSTDGFYIRKFKHLQFKTPYLIKFVINIRRNSLLFFLLIRKKFFNILGIHNAEINNAPFSIIMKDNIEDSHAMYNDNYACELLENILLQFCDEAYKRGHKPLILIMPQLIDLKIIRKTGVNPYNNFFVQLGDKAPVLDMTESINTGNLSDLYTEDVYGGHFSAKGNKLVAENIISYLNKT